MAMLESTLRNWKSVKRRVMSLCLALCAPSLILCSAYFAWNESVLGSLMPVSGSIKMDYSTIHIDPASFLRLARPSYIEYGFAFVLAAFGILVSLFGFGKDRSNHDRLRIVGITSLGYIIQVSNAGLFSSWKAFWAWHFYLSSAVVLIVTPFAAKIILQWFRTNPDAMLAKLSKSKIILVGCLSIIFSVLSHIMYYEKHLLPSSGGYVQSLMAANYVRDNTGKDAILAMGDMAGLFGYYCDRKVIQLEGLVNDLEYRDILSAGTLDKYLKDNGVGYLAAYAEFDSSVVSENYDRFVRVEPYHGGYSGPRDSITVLKKNEFYRKRWVRRNRQTAFVIWKLPSESPIASKDNHS